MLNNPQSVAEQFTNESLSDQSDQHTIPNDKAHSEYDSNTKVKTLVSVDAPIGTMSCM